MRIRLFQIDAFSNDLFRGNPAAVCPLECWPGDALLQAIAQENNLSETAFFVPKAGAFELRWFTPRCEVDLCGHATLAASFVLFNEIDTARQSICFESRSGALTVERTGTLISMSFPILQSISCPNPPETLSAGLGIAPIKVLRTDSDTNYFAIYSSEKDLRSIRPSLALLEQLHPYGVAVSAPGNDCDCVSRYFAPSYGIPEDPVTGSIHCALVPYWSDVLGKRNIYARQISARGGELFCRLKDDRVQIAGRAVRYLEGTINL